MRSCRRIPSSTSVRSRTLLRLPRARCAGGRLISHRGGIARRRSEAGTRSVYDRSFRPYASVHRACAGECELRSEIVSAELRLEAGDPVPGFVVRGTKPTASLSGWRRPIPSEKDARPLAGRLDKRGHWFEPVPPLLASLTRAWRLCCALRRSASSPAGRARPCPGSARRSATRRRNRERPQDQRRPPNSQRWISTSSSSRPASSRSPSALSASRASATPVGSPLSRSPKAP